MADVFVSYARNDKARVAPLVAAIEAKGWSVWWDPDITPGQEFDDQIEAEITAALAVLVVWTPDLGNVALGARRGARSRRARHPRPGAIRPGAPADGCSRHPHDGPRWLGRECGQSAGAGIPACARHAHCTLAGVATREAGSASASSTSGKDSPRYTICVLPFVNMSGDPEQEYFSDGITEDIITDLSKVSALGIIARNSAFMYKEKNVDILKVARELKVSHVLEGSVRKAGGRIRINAQLVDGETNSHVWADRYDRDSSDIFALQDEISEAIVKALKLRLLPEEKKAIERRGTSNAEAHNLYLMARQTYITSQEYEPRSAEAIVRLCARATEIDPNYAQAWALDGHWPRQIARKRQAAAQAMAWRPRNARSPSIPGLAEAHAIKAQILLSEGDPDAAAAEVATALELDPESYEVNRSAGRLNYQLHRHEDAIRYYEKAATLVEADLNSASMLISSYTALGDVEGMRRSAQRALKRAEAILVHDPNNSMVAGYSAYALAALGEGERAKARMERALLIDPKNFNMRYNFACALSVYLKDKDAALDMLGPVFESITETFLPYVKTDPDLDLLRDDPRYQAQLAATEARLAANAGKQAIRAT